MSQRQRERQSGAGRREVAYRLFAAEFDDATREYSDSDEERAPNYVVTPTGARVNRLFVVGVLTEVESVSDDVLRARVVDPTGAFVLYAGQYQPDAVTFLEGAEIPSFISVTGKARTYRPDDSERVFTSVRPESVNQVDVDTRDRWTVQASAHTVERIKTFAAALDRPERGEELTRVLADAGVDYGLASGIPLAIDHYGTTRAYLAALRGTALDAVRVVAGDRDEVEPLALAPDEDDGADIDLDVDLEAITATTPLSDDVEEEIASTPSVGEASTETTAGTVEDEPTPEGSPDSPAETADAEPSAADATVDSAASTRTEPDSTAVEESVGGDVDVTAEPEEDEEIGDFDDFSVTDADTDIDVDEDDLYEIDDEERERIEDEFGTEFSTGAEVDDPGEADIEPTPTPESESAAESTIGSGVDVESESALESEPASEPVTDDSETTATEPDASDSEPEPADVETTGEDEPPAGGATESDAEDATADEAESEGDTEAESVDLETAVVDAMREFDDGDGAEREDVIESVASEHDADRDAIEDAIQDALMSGKCYEPAEGRLKAI